MRRGSFGESLRRFSDTPAATGLLLASIGWTVWTALSMWGGMDLNEMRMQLREAWDTQAYFYVGIPVMAIAVAMAGYHMPERVWRWPLWLVGGHQLGVLMIGLGMQSGLSLFILTLILAILMVAFFTMPALAGSILARRMTERAY